MTREGSQVQPLSQEYVGLQGFAGDLGLPLRRTSSGLETGCAGCRARGSLSEILVVAFTSSCLQWKIPGEGGGRAPPWPILYVPADLLATQREHLKGD